MTAYSYLRLPGKRDVLGELLHSVSQPLTSLRCSLELSLAEPAEQQHESVTAALEQTESVIRMIQLMREYLDAEDSCPDASVVDLVPVMRDVVEDLGTLSALREVRLRVEGESAAKLRIDEWRLRKALEYLIVAMIGRAKPGGQVVLRHFEGPTGPVLRLVAERSHSAKKFGESHAWHDSFHPTLERVRLAIAARLLESAGAFLVVEDVARGFVLQMPRVTT